MNMNMPDSDTSAAGARATTLSASLGVFRAFARSRLRDDCPRRVSTLGPHDCWEMKGARQ
jgi:hypothetical protein